MHEICYQMILLGKKTRGKIYDGGGRTATCHYIVFNKDKKTEAFLKKLTERKKYGFFPPHRFIFWRNQTNWVVDGKMK